MSQPLASVVLLNYNGLKFLPACLESLKQQTYANFEVILVDNGSNDGSVEFIERFYADFVSLIKNPVNEGYSKGNNLGIRNSRGKYILVLNNDTAVANCWIEELVKAAETDEQVGMCASKIYLADEAGLIDSVGVKLFPDGSSKQAGWRQKDQGQFDQSAETFIPSGCAALYRKKMLDEIGLFDEDFEAYCEDTDLGLRGRLRGWRCALAPRAVVRHYYSGTNGRYSAKKAYLVERNHYWVAIKCFPVSGLLVLPFFTLLRFIAQTFSLVKIKKKEATNAQLLSAVLRAQWSAFIKIPIMLKKRRQIRSARVISDREFFSWFRCFGLSIAELALKDQARSGGKML